MLWLLLIIDHVVLKLHDSRFWWCTIWTYRVHYSFLINWRSVRCHSNETIGLRPWSSSEYGFHGHLICGISLQQWQVNQNDLASAKGRLFPDFEVLVLFVGLLSCFYSYAGIGSIFGDWIKGRSGALLAALLSRHQSAVPSLWQMW